MDSNEVFRESNVPSTNYTHFTRIAPQMPFQSHLDGILTFTMETKTEDELFVETWLSQLGKLNVNSTSMDAVRHLQRKRPQLTIHNAKCALKKCFEITSRLEATHRIMKENAASMETEEWKRHSVEIGKLKDEMTILMGQLQQTGAISRLKKDITLRAKKRSKQKRQRANLRYQRTKEQEELQARHKNIDLWLARKQEEAERAKAEEDAKREADCVLAEVTRKKMDARKQLSLLAGLVKLRTVREQAVNARGQSVSDADNTAFSNVTETLVNRWEMSMRANTIEEQSLQATLKRTASEDSKIEHANKVKEIATQWDEVLFGPKYPPAGLYWPLTAAHRDLETFIGIRKSWDTFVTSDPDVHLKIPLGCIVPESTPSFEWSCFLKK